MKLASRFVFTAMVVAASITVLSCTSEGPNAPQPVSQVPQASSGPYPVVDDSARGTIVPCDLALANPTADFQSDMVPFTLSCENMSSAMTSITRRTYNKFGCLTGFEGTIYFKKSRHSYDFEVQIYRTRDGADFCAKNGGYVKVCGATLGGCIWLRLPSITSIQTVVGQAAN